MKYDPELRGCRWRADRKVCGPLEKRAVLIKKAVLDLAKTCYPLAGC